MCLSGVVRMDGVQHTPENRESRLREKEKYIAIKLRGEEGGWEAGATVTLLGGCWVGEEKVVRLLLLLLPRADKSILGALGYFLMTHFQGSLFDP